MEDDEKLQELRNKRMRELMMKRSVDKKMTGDIIQANSSNFSEIINSSMPVLVDHDRAAVRAVGLAGCRGRH